ncbi:dTDP-4-dehydrorhamnose 3,5-epimerase family protein [Streptomyces sp. NPDC002845]
MKAHSLDIEGSFEFTPPVFRDDRGLFASTYQEAAFQEALGKPLFPVRQVSQNKSRRGVIRGIHYTATPPGMAKYVYCPQGRVQDYLVDLRIGSPTFGRWATTELDEDNCRAVYIPVGVGHAFAALEDDTIVTYVLSQEYVAANERAVSVLDPELGLPLPDGGPIQSDRDLAAPTLAQAQAQGLLPQYTACQAVEAQLWP